jgi:hypothetical protein
MSFSSFRLSAGDDRAGNGMVTLLLCIILGGGEWGSMGTTGA